MTEKPPLNWGKILLIAVLSGLISLGIVAVVFAPYSKGNDFGDLIETLFMLWVVVVSYLPLAAIVAFLLSLLMIRVRRAAHTALAVLVSLPVAFGVAFVATQILDN